MNVLPEVAALKDELIANRRWFHQHPEVRSPSWSQFLFVRCSIASIELFSFETFLGGVARVPWHCALRPPRVQLMFKEHETAAHIVELLLAMGVQQADIFQGIGGTGVVALIRGGAGAGPCIALRADMDALPVPETADVPYKSLNGNMHACGHDGHMAGLLAAARVLFAERAALVGTIKLVFQPAEEGGGGAEEMIKDGASALNE